MIAERWRIFCFSHDLPVQAAGETKLTIHILHTASLTVAAVPSMVKFWTTSNEVQLQLHHQKVSGSAC